MSAVNIRDLVRNFSHYLKEVKSGECITVLERRKAVAGHYSAQSPHTLSWLEKNH